MQPELIHYFSKYGYKAIFVLIFLQEIGVPNPIPNEFVLLFSGYLIFSGTLNFFQVIVLAVLADFIGTNLLYFTFYFFGKSILKHKPKWIPISEKKINGLKDKISRGGKFTIYIGRLTPLLRGYTSVITGLLQIKPKIFLPIALFSALSWSATYLLTGYLLGPYWDKVIRNYHKAEIIILCLGIALLIFILTKYLVNKYFMNKNFD